MAARQHPLDLVHDYGIGVRFKMPEAWAVSCGSTGEKGKFSRYLAAATYVDDAIGSRHGEHGVFVPHLKAYRFAYSDYWSFVMTLVCAAHMCLAFAERNSSTEEVADVVNHRQILFIELLILLWYAADTYLQWVGHERNAPFYFRSGWRRAKVVLVAISFLDALIQMGLGVGPKLRFLRFFWMIERVHTLRKTVNSIGKCIFQILRVTVIIVLLILLFGMLGLILFKNIEPRHASLENGFTSLWSSVLTLFTLLVSTSNFPNCMLFAYEEKQVYALYFVAFICIGVYLLMNLVLGMMYHTYKDRTVEDSELYRARTLVALSKAFALLDPRNTGEISLETFRRLMMYLKPKVPRDEVEILFKVIDYDGNNAISRGQFTHLIPFLKFRYRRNDAAAAAESSGCYGSCRRQLRDALEAKAENVLRPLYRGSRWIVSRFQSSCNPARARRRSITAVATEPASLSDFLFDMLVLVNTILLIVQVSNDDECRVDDDCEETWAIVHNIFLILYCAELALKVVAYGPVQYWFRSPFNRFDAIIIVASVVGEVTAVVQRGASQGIAGAEDEEESAGIAYLRVIRLLRVLRNMKRLQPIISSFLRVTKEIASLFGVVFVLFYPYAIIGMDNFGGLYRGNPVLTAQNPPLAYVQQDFWALNFQDLTSAYVTMFHILAVNNWWVTLEAAERVAPPAMAEMFFISFVIICSVLIINIMVAFVLEKFVATFKEERERGGVFGMEEALTSHVTKHLDEAVTVTRDRGRLTDLEVEMYGASIVGDIGPMARMRMDVPRAAGGAARARPDRRSMGPVSEEA